MSLHRRTFLGGGAFGLGAAALATLTGAPAAARPRARRVIHLFMAGGPSQIDLFDPKPALRTHDGQPLPESVAKGERFAFIKGTPRLLASPFSFRQHGDCGAPVSELLPHLAGVVDHLAFVKSMHTTQVNHAPAQIFATTGHHLVGRPSLGAWCSYGLGSQNRNLPHFAVLTSGERQPDGGRACWGHGFLPADHAGTELRSQGDPVLFLSNPPGVSARDRRRSLAAVRTLDRLVAGGRDSEVESRIAMYELAFRMQTAVPELADLSREPASVHERYGTTPGRPSYANNCLLARRLVERGCRFVQVCHRGWDTHGVNRSDDLAHRLPSLCRQTDRATAALIADLHERGLLDDTLVVWGGEFGRTPVVEARDGSKFLGRDHHRRAFTVWLAGAGVRAGHTVGRTDDLGYHVTDNPVSVHDLHATVLHLLGLDHEKLTFTHQGRAFRLTDVEGQVVKGVVT